MKNKTTGLTVENYKIHIEPDLTNFRFHGQTDIRFHATLPVSEVTLNIIDLAIWYCRILHEETFVDCPYLVDSRNETVLLAFPQEMEGEFVLRIAYEGIINDKMAGFYRSQYVANGKEHYIAVTQFEENDARRAFPCVDHPKEKATFDLELIIDKGLTALSNGVVIEEESLGGEKKRVRFNQTPKMSTYLLFIGVGAFDIIEDEKDPRVRAVTMPGLTPYAQLALDFGRKALQACERYFGIPYPLQKLDLIAIPDFAFGAMENWGAITFRENLLLYYPDITSSSGEQRICEVIAHELAHQWFGNLVTPSDWKYLWLNESFATYFAYGILNYFYPQWCPWDHFSNTQTEAALDRDALHETFPIEIPGGKHIVIDTSTAPIIYNKGGSILRQIEGYIGSSHFQKGISHYLRSHEYSSAASQDLWEAFETVTDKPITRMMKNWIEQPGFPVVKVHRNNSKLVLTQKRFTFLPNETGQQWIIPVTLTLFDHHGNSKQIKTLLENKDAEIEINDDVFAYKFNSGQTAFYRVQYLSKDNLNALGEYALNKNLTAEDRWGLQNDLFAFVRSGDATMDEYLSFLSFYENEDAYLPLVSISNNLFHAYHVFNTSKKKKIAALGIRLFEKVLANIGYEPTPDEPHTTSDLRDQIIWHLVLFGSNPVTEFAQSKFNALHEGHPVHPDIMRSILQVGAYKGSEKTFDWLVNRLHTSNSEHERMNVLIALGSFSNPILIEKTRQYVLDHVPDRNKFVPIVALTTNPYAVPSMWDWYVEHLSELEKCHSIIFERIQAAIIPRCGMDKADKVKTFLNEYIKKNNKTANVLRLSLEKLEINVLMKSG